MFLVYYAWVEGCMGSFLSIWQDKMSSWLDTICVTLTYLKCYLFLSYGYRLSAFQPMKLYNVGDHILKFSSDTQSTAYTQNKKELPRDSMQCCMHLRTHFISKTT